MEEYNKCNQVDESYHWQTIQSSFRHEKSRIATELWKYVYKLQKQWIKEKQSKESLIVWSIIRKINEKACSDFCKLCWTKKYFMMHALATIVICVGIR